MSEERTHLSSTTSLCPTCLERVPGTYEARDDAVFLRRSCPDHGTTSRKVWESLDHWRWARQFGPETDVADDGGSDTGDPTSDTGCCSGGTCSSGGGLRVDGDHACLAVVEITQDCNLSCSYCFASSGPGGKQLPFDEVVDLLDTVRAEGGTRPIQFSGGEPTVHDDLPELVERAREMGFEHVEVNTNGIELATQQGYAERLADAGVTAIYLQFDGVTRDTYETIRAVDLLEIKHEAIEACRDTGLPVILVPTVVPGTNDDEMGDVVRFALDNLDVVQSINFQPVAHFGRYAENEGRFSLDEAARRVADQLDGLEPQDFLPVPCCSSYCQMSTALVPNGEEGVVPLTGLLDLDNWDTLSGLIDEADWMELLAGTAAGRDTVEVASTCCGFEVPSAGPVLPVTLTGFMDADAADVDRLDNCCISVPTPDGDLVPFCAYNMTTEDGRYALRNRHGWGGRDKVESDGSRATAPVSEGEPATTGSEDD
ncbi:radical SAM protein [Halorarius halobius]|uniref:radical SAM protein n=1 Tax=Halorarius halobius TaxID=2962671 RepID=UPI0020CF016B|nr:radical SAM protein [Halorarius halobius]